MSTVEWDLVTIAAALIVALVVLRHRHKHALAKLDVAKYHAHSEIHHWAKTSLLGRKEVRVCPDCGPLLHNYKSQERHHEFHLYIFGLEDRIVALEKLQAEARGGGPAEEPEAIPWDGLTGELVEHAGAVDVTIEEPEPEQVMAFRDKYGSLFK